MSDPRPCERQCKECHEWKHHSRFRSFQRTGRNRSVSTNLLFSAKCRDCEQKERNEKKNLDRPLAIIRSRAAAVATKAGVSREFFMIHMNYSRLVPIMRAMMTDKDAGCLCCGHAFLNERDIQIEHWYPPRSAQDWARLHTRNLRFTCASCNGTKGHKPPAEWLDEQELARISNLKQPTMTAPEPWQIPMVQGSLFD